MEARARGAQTDIACNETKHLADVFPLSRWLPCAAGFFADGGGNGTVVFLTTDAPAVYRYAERHGADAVAPATLVMLPGGERAIGHTGARPERPRRKAQRRRRSIRTPTRTPSSRAAPPTWTRYRCVTRCSARCNRSLLGRRASARNGAVVSRLRASEADESEARRIKQVGTCPLSRCFPSTLLQPPHKAGQCARCAWHYEYMGRRIRRSTVVGLV